MVAEGDLGCCLCSASTRPSASGLLRQNIIISGKKCHAIFPEMRDTSSVLRIRTQFVRIRVQPETSVRIRMRIRICAQDLM
jgi:hypothetical protein